MGGYVSGPDRLFVGMPQSMGLMAAASGGALASHPKCDKTT